MSTDLKALIAKLNPVTRQAMEAAANLAHARTHFEVDVEHVLLGLLEHEDSDLALILRSLKVDRTDLERDLEQALATLRTGNHRHPVLSPILPRWLESAWLKASVEFGVDTLRSVHLLLALLEDEDVARHVNGAVTRLTKLPVAGLRARLPDILRSSREGAAAPTAAEVPEPATAAPTPALERYTVDLTALARAGQIDPVLGRDEEIRQMIDILLRRRQNNPILTGEPGVGKTAVVEGLALRIARGEVPPPLRDVCLRSLDLGLLQAGASVKGEFENRLRAVMAEVKASLAPVILFIDEAHTLIGAGGQAGQNDAANLLKPALARGELRTIAATTWSEYKKYFEKDAALARRFQVVKIEEPDEESAVHILRGLAPRLERHHGVVILDEAVVEAVKLSSRYLTGRQLPDKAIGVLDTACARVALSRAALAPALEHIGCLIENTRREREALAREGDAAHGPRLEALAARQEQLVAERSRLEAACAQQRELVAEIDRLRSTLAQAPGPEPAQRARLEECRRSLRALHRDLPLVYDCVDGSTIAEVVSAWTGIPLGRMVSDELETVRRLQSLLEERVVGQSHALAAIARRIAIAKARLEDPTRPLGVFLLVGPSGVGKTETALALADVLYGGERNLITINMSEYQEAHSVSGLKGSPPGYVGYGEGGVLTEAVRRRPYSVVLLDEVEKAHPDVLELFFQVFDKGVLEDGEGRAVDFRNTIILLTSNVGSERIMQAVAHGVRVDGVSRAPTPEDLIDLLRPELQRVFKPAFLGRLSVVPYYPIGEDVMRRIVTLKLERIAARVRDSHGARLRYDPALVDMIVARCNEVDSGARNADAIIADTVLARLSDEILARLAAGEGVRALHLRLRRGRLSVRVQ
ncbi:MAG: type VI secretion system ATPase TssH [Burkholderiales bacterium]